MWEIRGKWWCGGGGDVKSAQQGTVDIPKGGEGPLVVDDGLSYEGEGLTTSYTF